MHNRRIPFGKPFIVGKELFYIAKAVMDGMISGDGQFTQNCQNWLQDNLGTPKALLTQSCTDALEMAAILSNVGPGDEVIMPSFTFVSTANAFVLRGATPVFVDIRNDTLNIDEQLVEQAITPKTKAIVAVHYAGQACAMEQLAKLSKKHGLLLIEDAAQAILASEKGKALGSIGDLGCLSFHETKNVICGEGGALLINNPDLIARAEIIWQKGTNRKAFFRGEVDKYTWVDIGSSFLPGEITAAFLFAQLENAKKINAHRRMLHDKYAQLLTPLAQAGHFILPNNINEKNQNAHMFFIRCQSKEERTQLIDHLAAKNINAVFHYIPLHSSPAGQKYGRTFGHMTVTDHVSATLLRLPLYSELTADLVRFVCEQIRCFYSNATK